MKGKGKIFVLNLGVIGIFCLIILSPWGEIVLDASTSAGIILTNVVQVNWNSGPVSMSTNVTNTTAAVGTNYGMTWIGLTNLSVVSGTSISNDTYLTNDGNATADFVVSFDSNSLAASSSVIWTALYTNITSGGAAGDTLSFAISPAGGANIQFLIGVPGNETNGAIITFQCIATNSNSVVELGADATNYTGLNGTSYGGNIGMYGAGPGTAFLTNAQTEFTNWVVTAMFADIILTKTANISNAGPFAGNTTDPFPGALITYRLDFTNKGMAAGTQVKIVDSYPTNALDLKTGSIEYGTFGSAFVDYGTLTGLSDTEGNDIASTNSAFADQLVFCPTNGVAPATGGTVDPADAGAFYYQAYVK